MRDQEVDRSWTVLIVAAIHSTTTGVTAVVVPVRLSFFQADQRELTRGDSYDTLNDNLATKRLENTVYSYAK
jgi:hypothetical protein